MEDQLTNSSSALAIIHNSHQEIGFSYFCFPEPKVVVSQFIDSRSFSLLLNYIKLIQPGEIVFPNTIINSHLYLLLTNYTKCNSSKLVSAPRRLFNETHGFQMMKKMVVSGIPIEKYASKYLATSSFDALIQYLTEAKDRCFVQHSIQLEFDPLQKVMQMDNDTIKNLEILHNFRTGHPSDSLFAVMNHTQTQGGCRLLKKSLLHPVCDSATLNGRLDALEYLLANEALFFQIQKTLKLFPDIGGMLFSSQLIYLPTKKNVVKTGFAMTTTITNLLQVLLQARELYNLIGGANVPILQAIAKNLSNDSLTDIISEVCRIIEESPPPKRSGFPTKYLNGFLIKAGVSSHLDVARQTFNENMKDLFDVVDGYKEKYGWPSLKVQYTSKRGHFLVMDLSFRDQVLKAKEFNSFNQVTKKIQFSSQDIQLINQRNLESWSEIMIKSEEILQELIGKIRTCIGSIYKMADSISLMDMICSFATYVTLSGDCCRPRFTEGCNSPCVIKQGRHPILAALNPTSFISNDVFASEESNFQIITGPNMSGKSTFIRQIALLHVMAQTGCYVPASFASFRLTGRLFTRIGTFDQIDANASTFSKEMTEMAFILQNLQENDLVLIDELGRGTNDSDATPLCWSLCEHLGQSKAFTFFVTHLMSLTNLEYLYPNIKNFHLRVDMVSSSLSATGPQGLFRTLFQVGEGATKVSSYGITTAEKAGIPAPVIKDAKAFQQLILREQQENAIDFQKYAKQNQKLGEVVQKLRALRYSSLESPQEIAAYLETLKKQFTSQM